MAISEVTNRNLAFAQRWKKAKGTQLQDEILRRLLVGKPLRDLKIDLHDGKLDLRGLSVPSVKAKDLPPFRNWSVQQLTGQLTFRNARFENLDLSDSDLGRCLFFSSTITNCRFDRANYEKWKLWGTDVSHSTFIESNLREAVLGASQEGREDTYAFVDFSKADMWHIISSTATYTDCDFSNAKLEKIDFQSSGFIRCRFAGELRDIIFYDHGFRTGKSDPNPMEDVDFSRARLRWVEFRRLNLDRVELPDDNDHMVLTHYPCVLKRGLEKLSNATMPYELSLLTMLKSELKWLGPKQEKGVFSRLDFRERRGEQGEQFAVDLLREIERECSRATPLI